MIKPSDKVLIGWLTLLATFASANLGRVSASELSPNTEPSTNSADLADQPDGVESADAVVAANAQSIIPEAKVAQPEFSPQTPSEVAPSKAVTETAATLPPSPEPESALAEPTVPAASVGKPERLEHLVSTVIRPANPAPSQTATPQVPDRAAQLAHLVATSTREIPQTSSLLERSATPISVSAPSPSVSPAAPVVSDNLPDATQVETQPVVERPSAPNQVVNIPVEALPHTQIIPPDIPASVVAQPPLSNQAVAAERPQVSDQAVTTEKPQTSNQAIDIPVEALPTTRVMSPRRPQRSVRANGNSVVNRRQTTDSQVSFAQTEARVKPTQTARASQTIPEEAMPRSVVLRPDSEVTVSETQTTEVARATEIAQLPLEPPLSNSTNQADVDRFIRELDQVSPTASSPHRSAPSITISNPSGFGADNFIGYVGVGYQERTRFGNLDDGGMVVGMGFGDARENVGVQLSYTMASFGGSRDFGTGGFNAKLHRRLADEWSVALGWEGFATTGFVDFEDSIYGSVSHLIRTRENITEPFSRVALTAGVGNGRFRTEDAVFDDRDEINVFGSMAVRVAEPVSAIVEWTGQDLAAGLSITPFRDIPIVLLPAVRDITGGGDGGRFVMGAGVSFQL